jgi:glycerol-3-phosphate dehydrogenase (NAD(P)+)
VKIAVLGCGRWGTFHAWYADHIGHEVRLWGREGSRHFAGLAEKRQNEYLVLPESVELTQDLRETVEWADFCIISVSSQQLRFFARRLAKIENVGKIPLLLCMKGLEIGSGKRLSAVLEEELGEKQPVAVWVGPGHVQDFLRGIPNCMILASTDVDLTKQLVDAMSSTLIRFYYGEDLVGIEIGAAAKNVIGLAAGMLDGFSYGSLKGALMARGTKELSRLIEAMGGDAMTVYGLSHLGDYEATLFSPYSNNRRFGENLISGRPFTKLAEGVYTSEALMDLSEQYGVELPICRTVYEIIRYHKDPQEQLVQLFLRSTKPE